MRLRFLRIRFGELKDLYISSVPKAMQSLADTLRSLFLIFLVALTGGVVGTCVLSIHGTIMYTVSILAKGIAGAYGIMTGIAANLILLIISACLYAIPFGVRGVLMAFATAQILTLVSCWFIHWKRSEKAVPSSNDYLEMDDSFYTGPGDVISYPLETQEDCTLVSEQTILFCRGHKIEDRKCFLAGICVEELTVNAVEHGLKM